MTAEQCVRGPLAEEFLVITGELAGVPKSPLGGKILHLRERMLSRPQSPSDSIEAQRTQVSARADSAHVLECILQGAAAHMERLAKHRNRNGFVFMRQYKIAYPMHKAISPGECKRRDIRD